MQCYCYCVRCRCTNYFAWDPQMSIRMVLFVWRQHINYWTRADNLHLLSIAEKLGVDAESVRHAVEGIMFLLTESSKMNVAWDPDNPDRCLFYLYRLCWYDKYGDGWGVYRRNTKVLCFTTCDKPSFCKTMLFHRFQQDERPAFDHNSWAICIFVALCLYYVLTSQPCILVNNACPFVSFFRCQTWTSTTRSWF